MGAPGRSTHRLCLAWDAAMPFRADVVYILRDFCCVIIAAFLFPDVEPDPAIVAEARRFNVHLPCGSDKLMDRFKEIASGEETRTPISEPQAPGGVPGGLRRRAG